MYLLPDCYILRFFLNTAKNATKPVNIPGLLHRIWKIARVLFNRAII